MRRLIALLFAFCIWLTVVPVAFAQTPNNPAPVSGLVPCRESQAFLDRAQSARPTTDANSAKARFERYGNALCGPEGLPHLVVDGNLAHAGEFLIPSILFLYIAGWIGWVGRAYLQSIKKDADPELKEIQLDVPRAVAFMLSGFTWPLAAVKELLSGELTAKDNEIPVSPR